MSTSDDSLADRLRRSVDSTDAPELSPELVSSASRRRAPRLIDHGRAARVVSASLAAVGAVAVGSLVVANPFAPPPLFVVAATPVGATEASALADEARIALWIDTEYVAGPGLGTEGGSGRVYQLQRIGSPEQVLTGVAEQFGVVGQPTESEFFDPAWPTYVIGPEDGSGPSIHVTWSGTGSWWYNNPAAYPAPVCVPVEVETDTGAQTVEECTQPETPAAASLAPSEGEARGLAAQLFAAMGFEGMPSDIRVMADDWQTTATAALTVDGVATAVEFSVAWSALGEIAWASGHSIEVVDRGEFGTVSPRVAVERIADGRWYGAAGPDYQGGVSILVAQADLARDAVADSGDPDAPVSSPVEEPVPSVPSEPTEPTEPSAPTAPTEPGVAPTIEPGEPGEEPIVEPVPEPAPMPEPEKVTVTVDAAEATLLLLWDSDGNAWLVPGYAMQHPDGFWNTIVSLVEGVIELPPPFDGEITPFLDE